MPDARIARCLLAGMESAGVASSERVLVAVSGGPDSVALLTLLHELAPHRQWRLRVGHVNHGLRADASQEDEEFVVTLATELGLEADVARVETREYAAKKRLSLETAARELRYSSLRLMLVRWGGDIVATGHTQNDQAETMMMRLLRGSGLTGLAAMRWRSGAVVHPFLEVRREAILDYLHTTGRAYRIDASNIDVRHRRNLVRRDVIPALRAIQPRAVSLLARSASLLQRDADYLLSEAQRALQLLEVCEEENTVSANIGVWRAMHPSLQGATLRLLLLRLVGSLDDVAEEHVARLTGVLSTQEKSSLTSQLPRGINLYTGTHRFLLTRTLQSPGGLDAHVYLPVPGRAAWSHGDMAAREVSAENEMELRRLLAVCGPLHALCNPAETGRELVVRRWKPGDRMRPLGASGSRKLQDIFVDRHIPRSERLRIPVIHNGHFIVWIPGVALDERVAVTHGATRAVQLTYLPVGVRGNRTSPGPR